MRTLLAFTIGATLIIMWHVLGWRWIGWVLTHNLPTTPDGWTPRYRTWQYGIED